MAILALQCQGLAVAGILTPVWTVPVHITSVDGYAFLDWDLPGGGEDRFFKITETFQGNVTTHYTEATGLRAWRFEPGEYEFTLQVCVKNHSDIPDCGNASNVLSLNVSGDARTAPGTESSPGVELDQTSFNIVTDGGPDQLRPGSWSSLRKDAQGWSFYWANRLALSENDPLFGSGYDLVGVWFTFEAKLAQADPECPDCPAVTSVYRPIVVNFKAVSTGPDTYGGSLYIKRGDGSEDWIGAAEITFTPYNYQAVIDWNANFKNESLSDTDSLNFSQGSQTSPLYDISYLSGVWNNGGNDEYYVVSNVGGVGEGTAIIFHDDAGDPTWIEATSSGTPKTDSRDLCFRYLAEGYSPQLDTPDGWTRTYYENGCAGYPQSASTSNRNGRRYFSGLDKQYLWAEFTLPGTAWASGSITIGNNESPVVLSKAANFHSISYDSVTGPSCELTGINSSCGVQISWYTDGYFPDATVFAHNLTSSVYDVVAASVPAVMSEVPFEINNEGVFEFELRIGNSVETTLIAKTNEFSVTENIANSPPAINVPGTQKVVQGTNINLSVPVNDVDNDSLSCGDDNTLPAGLTVTIAPDNNTCDISGYLQAQSGTYTTVLTVDDGNGHATSGQFDWDVYPADGNPETPPAPAMPPDMTASSNSSKVGATVGEFRVDESGSATYSIPILTAPASGGVTPGISLNYSSQTANGEIGVGWAFGGISVISRCPQTMEQDSIQGSRGINLDSEDRFCLDGKRLIADTSTGEYGNNGTRYRTEIDNFARITSYGTAGHGPAWFKVERKDGAVLEYGNSTDSRIEARGSDIPETALTWAQNRFEDRFGNYILYSYLENNSGPVEFVLSAIDYAGNDKAATLPSARLSFEYYDRNESEDLTATYIAGVELERRRLLQSIRSQGRLKAGSQLEDLRFYELDYDEDGMGRKILSAITECRSIDRTICYQPTRFDWLKSESMIDTSAIFLDGLLPKKNLTGLMLADASGDSRPDLLYTQKNGKGFFLHVKEAAASGFSEWNSNYKLAAKSARKPPRVFAIDINSDGVQDVVYSRYSETTEDYSLVALLSTGDSFSTEIELNPDHRFSMDGKNVETRFQILDFNGDGLSDILHAHTYEQGSTWVLSVLLNTTAAGDPPSFSTPIDLDVDNSDLFPSDPTGEWKMSGLPPFFNSRLSTNDQTDFRDARIVDFNGDGAVDLLVKVWREYSSCVSNCAQPLAPGGGTGSKTGEPLDPVYVYRFASFWVLMESDRQDAFYRHGVVALGADCTLQMLCGVQEYQGLPRTDHVWPVDINADGLADLAWGSEGGRWHYQLNTGKNFTTAELIAEVPVSVNQLVRFEDWNGDSYPDLIYPSAELDNHATWMVYQNHFGRLFAASSNTLVPAGNVGGNSDTDTVENDSSIFADFDGDAKTDHLFIDHDKRGEIASAQIRTGMNVNGNREIEPANVVTTITNGFGAMTSVIYRPLTDTAVYTRMYDSGAAKWGNGAPVYDYTAPLYVVSEVSGSLPTFADSSAVNRTEYHYVGAKLQAGGRGLLGFAEIIDYDPQLQVRTNTRYRQDFPFTGVPVDTTRATVSEGLKFSPITAVDSRVPASWSPVSTDTQAPSGTTGSLLNYNVNRWFEVLTISGVHQIYSDVTLNLGYTLSGNLKSKVHTHNSFDQNGNLASSFVNTFAGNGEAPFSNRTTYNHWSATDLPKWDLGRLENSTVTHSRVEQTPVTRESSFEYDDYTGAMTKETIEPDSTSLSIITTYEIDAFGNRTTTSIKGAGMNARINSVTYDSLGRFVISESNALGEVFRRVIPDQWDVFGNPTETENIDGVVSKSSVDFMGRVFATYNETGAWKKTLYFAGRGNHCPTRTAWYSITENGGGEITQQCFDVIGRVIRKLSNSINNRKIFVDQYFDDSGRPSHLSEPYFEDETLFWNETAYDTLGRITEQLSAGGDDNSIGYDEQASGACTPAGPGVTVTTNALGQRMSEVKNVLGETTESFDDFCGHVHFDYDSMGNPIGVTGEDGFVVTMGYDGRGRKIAMSDPDKGDWQYAYNALGELTRQLDSKRQAIDFEYDALGRVTHRRELNDVDSLNDTVFHIENHETTQYRTARPGRSQPGRVTYRAGESGDVIHQRSNGYDWLGRVSDISTVVAQQQFFEQTTYDAYGRPFQQFDASGGDRGLRYVYSNGRLKQLKEAREGVNGVVYQDILEMDARGNVTLARLGNGVEVVADYASASGRLIRLGAYDSLGAELQDVDYLFDVLGNLKSRHDRSGSIDLKETFAYDRLNRLEQVNLTAPQLGIPNPLETLALVYDGVGNISWKSDIGSYTYGSGNAGPHAVTQAGNATYGYDANGNQVLGGGREVTYTVFDKAAGLTLGDQNTTFTYGIGNHRVQRRDSIAGVEQKSTLYLGNAEYVSKTDGSSFFRRYLGGTAIANYYPATSLQHVTYLLKDHIGSIHSVLDSNGLVTTRMHFSPFGERQDIDWQSSLDGFMYAQLNELTTRGFTGHEHVDSMGIIHMNGRIYDPKLGRFLQADPAVQTPKNSQSLNRYSYVLNNPLSYTDPSGFFSIGKFFKKWGRLIVAAVASYFTFGAAYAWAASGLANAAAAGTFVHGLAVINTVAGAIAGATAGFVGGAIISGSIKGAVRGAFAGAITGGIAKYYGDSYTVGRVTSESVGGGASARILGGKFEDGLKFALLISSVTYINYRMDLAERTNSARNPDNLNKPGSGLFGRKFSIAGARRTIDPTTGRYVPCGSPAGGCQSLPLPDSFDQESNLVGIPYTPKGSIGYIVDTFAGPHDWLRNHVSRSYDALGNARYFTGARKFVDQFANGALIPVAAPFSTAALIGTQPSVYVTANEYLYGN